LAAPLKTARNRGKADMAGPAVGSAPVVTDPIRTSGIIVGRLE
jgi:hypothetical protein